MRLLTITARGQMTLGKDLLQHLGVRPGDKIAMDKLPSGCIEVKAVRPAGRISDVFGMLKKKDRRTLSVDEINKITAEGWMGRQ